MIERLSFLSQDKLTMMMHALRMLTNKKDDQDDDGKSRQIENEKRKGSAKSSRRGTIVLTRGTHARETSPARN